MRDLRKAYLECGIPYPHREKEKTMKQHTAQCDYCSCLLGMTAISSKYGNYLFCSADCEKSHNLEVEKINKNLPKKFHDVYKDINQEINKENERVNHPSHYTQGSIECIQVTENMPFLEGNIIKYVWRHKYKNGAEDIKKAIWYCQRLLLRDYGEKFQVEMEKK